MTTRITVVPNGDGTAELAAILPGAQLPLAQMKSIRRSLLGIYPRPIDASCICDGDSRCVGVAVTIASAMSTEAQLQAIGAFMDCMTRSFACHQFTVDCSQLALH
jgi:hypothetical protein